MPHLKVSLTKNIKETFEVRDGDVIGRGKQANIVLLDQSISRAHGKFIQKEGRYLLTNIASNPFFVNHQAVQESIELHNGDEIEFGSKKLEYCDTEDVVLGDFFLVDLIEHHESEFPDSKIFGKTQLLFRCKTDETKVKAIEEICNRYIAHLQVDTKSAMGLETVLNESLNNAARHAHKFEYDKIIQLVMILKPHEIRYQVIDQGPGFDYAASLERGRNVDAVQAARERYQKGGYGGIGFVLMLKCVDHIEFNNSGTKMTLIKLLNPPIQV